MKVYDVVGVGFGPSNLATAVAIEELAENISYVFLEKNGEFSWHKNMLLPNVTLQNSFLKDLITLKNPQSKYTFVNYLKSENRLSEFANLRTFFPSRLEVLLYMKWVASHFEDHVSYNEEVFNIDFVVENNNQDELIKVSTRNIKTGNITYLYCRNIVVGVGAKAYRLDKNTMLLKSERLMHSDKFLVNVQPMIDHKERYKNIMIIGGGQSSAEILEYILSFMPETHITVSSRSFLYKTLEENLFINNLFSDDGVSIFNEASEEGRELMLKDVRNANYSAVNSTLANKLYSIMYNDLLLGKKRVSLNAYHELVDYSEYTDKVEVILRDLKSGETKKVITQCVIFCTGYTYQNVNELLANIKPLLEYDHQDVPIRNDNYSIQTKKNFPLVSMHMRLEIIFLVLQKVE